MTILGFEGDPTLLRPFNSRCRHARPQVRSEHRPDPSRPSRDPGLAAHQHLPHRGRAPWPRPSPARTGQDLEGHRCGVRPEHPTRPQMGRAIPTSTGWLASATSPGPAASRSFPPTVALHLVKMACERPDDRGRSLSTWDCRETARQVVTEGIVSSISPETVRRILEHHHLKPNTV